jgi:hypothetical protein
MTSDKCTSNPTRFSKARLLAWADLQGGSDRVKFAARAEYKAFNASPNLIHLKHDTYPEHAAMLYLCDSQTSFQLGFADGRRNQAAAKVGTDVGSVSQRRACLFALRDFEVDAA